VQFHWSNRGEDSGGPWRDWTSFLASLQREKRKKIQQERRRVAEAGVTVEARLGSDIRPDDWEHFHRCYVRTYREHGNAPYLTRDFFARLERTMPGNWLLFTAWREGRRIAASLLAVDPSSRVAYGRYWGATEHVPLLHFEACYYAPLDWCIAHRYRRFEGGAQGEHKMARGLMPVETRSAHWLADARFARAVDDFLAREGAGVAGYLAELDERTPFRAPPSGDPPSAA
jgi:predicted N-acyltransferase